MVGHLSLSGKCCSGTSIAGLAKKAGFKRPVEQLRADPILLAQVGATDYGSSHGCRSEPTRSAVVQVQDENNGSAKLEQSERALALAMRIFGPAVPLESGSAVEALGPPLQDSANAALTRKSSVAVLRRDSTMRKPVAEPMRN